MAVCTYNICLTGYACPVVTKATSSALYVEAIEGLCKNCKYADNIEDRLKNYNSVGSECLAFSSTSPLPIMQSSSPSSISTKEPSVSPGTNSSPSNGPITKELPVTICVITLGILAVFFAYVMIKVKSQRNPPKWLFCEQFYIAYTYLLTCRSLFIIFTFVWKWNRMPSWGYIKSLSFVLWTEQRVVHEHFMHF